MGRYKKREVVHVGVDYLKCTIKAHEKAKFFTLGRGSTFDNVDNDTQIILEPRINSFLLYYSIKDTKTGINLAFFGLNGIGEARDFFEITGQGLILRDLEYYFNLRKIIGFDILLFTRVDICIDFCDITVDDFYKLITPTLSEEKRKKLTVSKETKKKIKKIYYGKENDIETLYIGEKSRKKNNYQLIRIYNKLLDSHNKKKEYLYKKYDDFKVVTRIELEMREEKAKYLTIDKILSDSYIFTILAKSIFRLNRQFFSFIHFEDLFKNVKEESSKYHDKINDIAERQEHFRKYGTSFLTEKEKFERINVFCSYGKRLLGDGYKEDELIKLIQESLNNTKKFKK